MSPLGRKRPKIYIYIFFFFCKKFCTKSEAKPEKTGRTEERGLSDGFLIKPAGNVSYMFRQDGTSAVAVLLWKWWFVGLTFEREESFGVMP